MTLNAYLAAAGICSRRNAVQIIESGKVMVNDRVITHPGYRVQEGDRVVVAGKTVKPQSYVYVLLNKPTDCVSTVSDEKGRRTVLDVISHAAKVRLYPVGRLDRDTTGLLLLTNDGALAHRLMHPKFEVRKIYHVVLNRSLEPEDIMRIKKGIVLEDGKVSIDSISYIDIRYKNGIKIELHSGRYRIIRRLFESLGYEVAKLDRVRYAHLTKKNLPLGQWRYLNKREIAEFKSNNTKG